MNKLFLILIFLLSSNLSAQEEKPNTFAVIKTSHGDIRVMLYDNLTPKTVLNFIGLAKGLIPFKDPYTGKKVEKKSFYRNMIFHKIHPELGIQTGCPWGTGKGWPGFTLADEISKEKVFDQPYLLAMAKIDGQPTTAGSQFFITTKALPHLNEKYTIFGETVSGFNVVKKISRQPRDAMMKPLKPIRMKEIIIE